MTTDRIYGHLVVAKTDDFVTTDRIYGHEDVTTGYVESVTKAGRRPMRYA